MRDRTGQVWEFVHGSKGEATIVAMVALYVGEWRGVGQGSRVVVLDSTFDSMYEVGGAINLPWHLDECNDSDSGACRDRVTSWWRRVT
jgi:hypothetical protein